MNDRRFDCFVLSGSVIVSIFTISGSLVKVETVNSTSLLSVGISALSTGTYILKPLHDEKWGNKYVNNCMRPLQVYNARQQQSSQFIKR